MKDYTIYVTEEIAKKAMEKGFPLQKVYEQYTGQPPIYYTLPHSDPNWYQCDAYYLPTAEQICGWLRKEKNIDIELCIDWADETPIGYYCDILLNKRKMVSGDGKTYGIGLNNAINKALDMI